MTENPVPKNKSELINFLTNMSIRQYMKEFNLDRLYAQQVYAIAKKHPEFLIDELLELSNSHYKDEREKVECFMTILQKLSSDTDLRVKLQHSILSKLI